MFLVHVASLSEDTVTELIASRLLIDHDESSHKTTTYAIPTSSSLTA